MHGDETIGEKTSHLDIDNFLRDVHLGHELVKLLIR